MIKKGDEIEDKATPGAEKPKKTRRASNTEATPIVDKETWVKPRRRGWDDASFDAVMAKHGGVSEEETTIAAQDQPSPQEGVEIRMKTGRQWRIGERLLRPGERVTLDETTAETIVDAGYAVYVAG